ncbi:hypothetical protein [uncultured Pseudodesulfovibrio sp.]|uniref:hypothetical protein n=1 Tax=uncultured Pseudodesulfovibrio sp. TaxID=2035858 RepID=UPI0029C73B59|nr:hypothetical protein [uncultured Pseudodesulfovibrio sp.]
MSDKSDPVQRESFTLVFLAFPCEKNAKKETVFGGATGGMSHLYDDICSNYGHGYYKTVTSIKM